MTTADRYVKIVEWSDEDGVFVGQCPGVIGACCHGTDEVEVYRQLCVIVSEWLELADRDGTPIPPPTAGRGLAGKIVEQLYGL
jgi:predicted RNase H-like HicB family nuclease